MPREDNPSPSMPEVPGQGDEWDGPWGPISPVPHSVDTPCIQIENELQKPRIYYYRTISKWNWNTDDCETLEIQVGTIQIAISGAGLRRLAEALNFGQLRLIQSNHGGNAVGEISVRSIIVENNKT